MYRATPAVAVQSPSPRQGGWHAAAMRERRGRRAIGVGVRLALALALVGCSGGSSPSGDAAADDRAARLSLDYWARQVQAHPQAGFAVFGPFTGTTGQWELRVAGRNAAALEAGVVALAPATDRTVVRTAEVRWSATDPQPTPVLSPEAAVAQLQEGREAYCGQCVPLRLGEPDLRYQRYETSRGAADLPVWSFPVDGSRVRVTRLALPPERLLPTDGLPPDAVPRPASSDGVMFAELTAPDALTVSVQGGGCGRGPTGVRTLESRHAVVVIVTETGSFDAGRPCPAMGTVGLFGVTLAGPLGGRAVLTAVGAPVPLHVA